MNNLQETKQRKLTKIGDVWQLGEHRLGCGSASDAEFVKVVVGGGVVREILCDPPYGVGYKNAEGTTIENDELQSDEQYENFTEVWMKTITPYLDSYNTAYIFGSDSMLCPLKHGFKKAGFYYSSLIIWVKSSIVMGRKDYLPQHELLIYGWMGRHKRERSQGKSVIFYPKSHESKLHPTMKPVGLIRQFILNSTKINEVIYDPFGGSGTTLIACEQTKRKCIMLEIDPNYIATIIERWEKETSLTAEKVI